MSKVRIYGKVLREWWTETIDQYGRVKNKLTQIEYSYKEYDTETGQIRATGSEDFSKERMDSELILPSIYTWDGQRRNRGGFRWFDYRGILRIRKADRKALKEYMKVKYNAAFVDLRR